MQYDQDAKGNNKIPDCNTVFQYLRVEFSSSIKALLLPDFWKIANKLSMKLESVKEVQVRRTSNNWKN